MTTTYSFIFLLLCGLGIGRTAGQTTGINHEKVCVGNGNGVSSSVDIDNDDYHYQSLKERFEGCTFVDGNLEVKFIRQSHFNMSFLKDIKEVTGYVLILLYYPAVLSFPNLRIIRGSTLYEGDLALYVATTYHNRLPEVGLRELHFPKLHEIIKGKVKFVDNRDLCYVKTIDWHDLRPDLDPWYSDHATSCPEDPPCAPNCPGGCWGSGPDMCQVLTRKNCSGTCDYRCRGPTQADCCHRSCAAGCTGPSNRECLACLKFTMDDQCVEACPPRTIYNPDTFQNEPNPDFRYAYGPRCLTKCPDNVLEEGDNCINECPTGTVESTVPGENKCVECDGPCPKVCDGVESTLYREDFINGSLSNCTIIKKNIFIGTSSFEGDPFSGKQGISMELLERLSTVQEVKGFVSIQGHHVHFTNLTFLRNLKKIYGRKLYGNMSDHFVPNPPPPHFSSIDGPKQYSLFINSDSLESLGLTSLQRINKGNILFYENPKLCYAAEGMWDSIMKQPGRQTVEFYQNKEQQECIAEGHVCDPQCAPIGCWGSGPKQCARCQNARIGDTCIAGCNPLSQYVASEGTEDTPTVCAHCDPECKGRCRGPGPQNCTECLHVKDGPFCRKECPISKYPDEDGVCQPCHSNCVVEKGCTGPDNRVGQGGCVGCHQALVEQDGLTVLECMPDGAQCGNNSFYYHVGESSNLPLRGYSLCQMCDHNCLGCHGAGPSSCKQCKRYRREQECADECFAHQFPDQNDTCQNCHRECRGCSGGSSPYDCIRCQNLEVLESQNVTYCAKECPPDYPYNDRNSHCVANCSENEFANKNDVCMACHQQCLGGCFNDRRSSCFQCRNVKHGRECLEKCPEGFLNSSGVCMKDPSLESTRNPQKSGTPVGTIVGITVSLVAIIIVAIIAYIVYNRLTKSGYIPPALALKDLQGANYGNGPLTPSGAVPNQAQLKIIKETELKRGSVLGSGAFGTVYRGLWIPEGEAKIRIPVAIKVLREVSPQASEELLEEAKVMASVDHPYLLRLACVCMAQEISLITQLMPLGALLDYVREHKDRIGSHHLLNWCYQIAQGMVYLEEKHLIHRDLAARNVLVQTAQQVKITDFGLAKFLDVDESEFQAQGGKMPIKWLALECIHHRRFSHKSDVWSFGVTMWELMTFGGKPYDGVRARDVPDLLEKGERLQQPPISTIDVYMLMVKCWMLDEESRPSFKQLSDELGRMAKDPQRYLVIQNDGEGSLAGLPSPVPSDFYRSLIGDEIDGAKATDLLMDAEEYLQPMSFNNLEHRQPPNEFFPSRTSGADFVAGGPPMSPTYPYSLNSPPAKVNPTRKDSSMRYAPDPTLALLQGRQNSNDGATAVQIDDDYLTPSIKGDYHDLTKDKPILEEPQYQNDPKFNSPPLPEDTSYLPLSASSSGPPSSPPPAEAPPTGMGVDNLEYHALLASASPPVIPGNPWKRPQEAQLDDPRYMNEEQMGHTQPLLAGEQPRPLYSPSHSSSRPGSSIRSNGSSSVGVRLSGAASDNELEHDYINTDLPGVRGETSI
ncbi:epidermal growth factor receptor-like isoform X2 [Acanthaster planci]|uniref:receptor protein-tyrosine kinase n=1 Tax=Acanthaster planci TaxID=133434 RepID=A0A8B7ZE95_ACAPL|nr:epidermal growth factor receptor-like isoform X2 [Acanthaster planci]